MVVNKVEGLAEVTANLNREISQIEGRSMDGLLEGGQRIQAESQRRVPVDTGYLKSTAYTRRARVGGMGVEIGYSAKYAAAVHELVEKKLAGVPRTGGSGHGHYWDSGEPKYLESAVRDNVDNVLEIIQRKARV